jgi:hypothetical protein
VKVTKKTYCKHLAVGSWRESRLSDKRISLLYKVQWRLESLLRRGLNRLGYILIKKI